MRENQYSRNKDQGPQANYGTSHNLPENEQQPSWQGGYRPQGTSRGSWAGSQEREYGSSRSGYGNSGHVSGDYGYSGSSARGSEGQSWQGGYGGRGSDSGYNTGYGSHSGYGSYGSRGTQADRGGHTTARSGEYSSRGYGGYGSYGDYGSRGNYEREGSGYDSRGGYENYRDPVGYRSLENRGTNAYQPSERNSNQYGDIGSYRGGYGHQDAYPDQSFENNYRNAQRKENYPDYQNENRPVARGGWSGSTENPRYGGRRTSPDYRRRNNYDDLY